MSSITQEQSDAINHIVLPLHLISLISSLTACITFSLIRIYYPKLADRVSFRLTFVALFCDIGYASHNLAITIWNQIPGLWCGYAAWGTVFFPLCSIFFIDCIALNLHIIFVNEYRPRYNFEKYYFIIAFSFALFLSLLPATANMYGYDAPESGCWYRDSGQTHNIIWEWVTLFGWIDASILYCTTVVIMIIWKLRTVSKQVEILKSSNSQSSDSPTLINKKLVSSVVRRVMWYPIVPLVAQFFNSYVETYAYVNNGDVPFSIFSLCLFGISIQGLLNSLVFAQDIAVTHAFKAVKLHWWVTIVSSYESHYPHRSHNKAITNEYDMLRKSNDFIELKALNSNNADYIKNDIILNISSTLVKKDDSKQDITPDNQYNDQNIYLVHPESVHLKDSSTDLSPDSLNPSTSSNLLIGNPRNNVIDISNLVVGDEENQINITFVDGEPTKRISEEFPEEVKMLKLTLK
ncbi:11912_t:CDS:2, partial [Dentiscutata erythropus]